MNTKDFIRLGIPLGEATRRATDFVLRFILSGGDKTRLEEELKAILANPALFAEDPLRKELAKAIVIAPPPPRAEPVKYRQWGEGLEHEAVMQMEKACLLPVAFPSPLGCGRRSCSDFCRELLNLALEATHIFQRSLREDGEFLRLPREQFLMQSGEGFIHPLQLFYRLGQDTFRFAHSRIRNRPFVSSGASRTRLKTLRMFYTASCPFPQQSRRTRTGGEGVRVIPRRWTSGKSQSKSPAGRNPSEFSAGIDIATNPLLLASLWREGGSRATQPDLEIL
jgi:hypothetical protein